MKKGYLYIIVTIVMFTSYEVVLRYIAGQINSMQLTLCRFSVGFLILLPLALRTLRRWGKAPGRPEHGPLRAAGPAGHRPEYAHTPSVGAVRRLLCGRGAVQLQPGICHLLAFFLLKEPIQPRHIAALALEIAGTVAIIDPFGHALNPLGVGLALLSTLLFSLYGVLGKRRVAEYGGAVVTCFSFLFGSLIVLGLILLSHVPAVAQGMTAAGLEEFARIPILAGYTLENLPYVLYVSVGVAGIGFCCYFLAMEELPASVVSLVYFFKPALAPVLAWQLHGEAIPANMMAGILLIVGRLPVRHHPRAAGGAPETAGVGPEGGSHERDPDPYQRMRSGIYVSFQGIFY